MHQKTSYDQLKEDIGNFIASMIILAIFLGHLALSLLYLAVVASIAIGLLYLIYSIFS